MSATRPAIWCRREIEDQFERLRAQDEPFTKIAEDIWCTDGPIGPHADNTAPGLVVYGLVLINDIGLDLHYRGGIFPLKVGDAYCIDGHQDHAALGVGRRNGLFAVRVWDAPPGMTLDRFIHAARSEPVAWLP